MKLHIAEQEIEIQAEIVIEAAPAPVDPITAADADLPVESASEAVAEPVVEAASAEAAA